MSMDGVFDWIGHRYVHCHSILAGYLLLLRYAVETIVIAMHNNNNKKWQQLSGFTCVTQACIFLPLYFMIGSVYCISRMAVFVDSIKMFCFFRIVQFQQ